LEPNFFHIACITPPSIVVRDLVIPPAEQYRQTGFRSPSFPPHVQTKSCHILYWACTLWSCSRRE